MRYGRVKKLKGKNGPVTVFRTEEGVSTIEAGSMLDACVGLGWVHAMDRYMQMILMVCIGQGRASELLVDREELVLVDIMMRKMNLWNKAVRDAEDSGPDHEEVLELLNAYSDGVNHFRGNHFKPIECMLIGLNPPLWTPAHSLLIGKLMGYAGFVQAQENAELFILQAIQRGTGPSLLEELFSPHLKGCDFDLLRKVTHQPVVDLMRQTLPRFIPAASGSNNWVISPKRSVSGNAILCNDPHLEINRLPPVWYETIIRTSERSLAGVGVPGVPGIFIGRNVNLSFGVTYTMADTTDFWVHQCKRGRFLWKGKWSDFKTRREIIHRKGSRKLLTNFYELPDGSVLNGEPLKDGYYLSVLWSGAQSNSLDTLEHMIRLNSSSTVKDGMKAVSKTLFPALNWVFADKSGNIGFQVGGSFPRRKKDWSGLFPLPGWNEENLWNGTLTPQELPSEYNPKRGYIVTANNDINQKGKPVIINLPLPSDRAERIGRLIQAREKVDLSDMKNIQYDTYSIQAEKIMPFIRPLLAEGPQCEYFREWDLKYDIHSYGPEIFENVYRELILTVLGDGGLGRTWFRNILETTPLGETVSLNLDRILLKKHTRWVQENERDKLWEKAVRKALLKKVSLWGDTNVFTMMNLFFNGFLPNWTGFDAGPFPLPGGRATPCQGNLFTFWKRKTSFAPSYRLVTDMAENFIETNLPGGPSGNRFSRWYLTDIARFFGGKYKKLHL